MTGLLLKDLLVLRQQARIYLFMLVMFGAIALLNKDLSFAGGMAAILAVMMPITALSYDERAGWDRLALSMPVSRRDMVLSKYLLGAGFATAAFLLILILELVSPTDKEAPRTALVQEALLYWSLSMVVFSVLMPLFIRFGVEKGRVLMIAVLFLPTGLLLFAARAGWAPPSPQSLDLLLNLAPLIALAAFAASGFLSLRLYQKREY